MSTVTFPTVVQTVLDTTDARGLAEFYRELLGLHYRLGDEPPPSGHPDPRGSDWLVLTGRANLAFQQVEVLPPATWPAGEVPQQLHLDMTVPDATELDRQHVRILTLGAHLIFDRATDSHEPLRVYTDPAGHPFCVFVG